MECFFEKIDYEKKILIQYPLKRGEDIYQIPESTIVIEKYVLHNNNEIQYIRMNERRIDNNQRNGMFRSNWIENIDSSTIDHIIGKLIFQRLFEFENCHV